MTTVVQLLPELSLLLTAMIILVLDVSISDRFKRFIPIVAMVGIIAGLVFTINQWAIDVTVLRVLKHDSITIFAFLLVYIVMIGLTLISSGYMDRVTDNVPLFYAILMLNGLAALLLVSTTNILMLMLSLEFLSLTSYVLTGFLHYNIRSTEAAIKYLIYGSIISALMLYGISWLYGLTGHTDYVQIAEALIHPGEWFSGQTFPASTLLPILIFISAGFAFKIAAAPFHQWAPDAYEGAPTPVTAMLATVPKIAGFVVLLRVSLMLFPVNSPVGRIWQTPLLGILSAMAMLFGSFGGLWQTDVKRMMAYSGISQAGYVLMGLATGTIGGIQAQLVQLVAYVTAVMGIFAVIIVLSDDESPRDLTEFRGLYHRSPLLALAMLFTLMSLTGVPGTIGFIGKFTLFKACLESGYLWLVVVAMINTVVSFGYYWKLIRLMWLEKAEVLPSLELQNTAFPVLVISVAGVVGIGLFPNLLIRLVQFTLQHLG